MNNDHCSAREAEELAASLDAFGAILRQPTQVTCIDDSLGARAVRSNLHRLARAARNAGFVTYSSGVLRLVERLEPDLRTSGLNERQFVLLRHWAQLSLCYFAASANFGRAADLVNLLNFGSAPAFGIDERIELLAGLLREAVRSDPLQKAASVVSH